MKTKTYWRKTDEQIQSKFFVNSNANFRSTNTEVVDLVDDYGYTEKEAEAIINDEEKLKKEFDNWLWDTIETGFQVIETEDEVED